MTYTFPQSLRALRDFLKSQGFEGDSIKTSRQSAFVAQQLLGTRIKFPPQGSDMTSTLMLIQKALAEMIAKRSPATLKPLESSPSKVIANAKTGQGKARSKKEKKSLHKRERPIYLNAFTSDLVKRGFHIFADGAAVPNPGAGGWGFAAYRDGEEIHAECGGEADTTNNRMEISAALMAIKWAANIIDGPVTIWCDSQYVVNGVNAWRSGWKAKGWQRGGGNAEPKNRLLLNADLWQAIDAALCDPMAANINVQWVKGHAGHVGNERADELAEIGRQSVQEMHELPEQDLDAEYRSIMAG